MALIFCYFFSEEITQLKAFRDTLKDEKQKAELDKIIESLEKKAHEHSEN